MCTCDKLYHRVQFVAGLSPCRSYELNVLNGVNSFLKTFTFLIEICSRREQPQAGNVSITVCCAEQGTSAEGEESDLSLCPPPMNPVPSYRKVVCPVTVAGMEGKRR